MDNLLTPHQAVEVVLLASHLDYDESGIFENAQISLTVETSETYYEAVKDGKIGRTKVTVVAQLIRESGLAAPLLSLRVVAGVSAVLHTEEEDDSEQKAMLRRQSIADGYSFLRSHILQMTALSPLHRILLPSIDEDCLIDG